jgi:hypothetical protein
MTTCPIELGTTLPQLRASLAALFADHLGVFTLPDGQQVPAIRARPKPKDWKVQGIELTIERSPSRVLLAALGGPMTVRRIWRLQFRQFDPEGSLDPVRVLALQAVPHLVVSHLPATDDTFEQLTLELPDPVLIPPLR